MYIFSGRLYNHFLFLFLVNSNFSKFTKKWNTLIASFKFWKISDKLNIFKSKYSSILDFLGRAEALKSKYTDSLVPSEFNTVCAYAGSYEKAWTWISGLKIQILVKSFDSKRLGLVKTDLGLVKLIKDWWKWSRIDRYWPAIGHNWPMTGQKWPATGQNCARTY